MQKSFAHKYETNITYKMKLEHSIEVNMVLHCCIRFNEDLMYHAEMPTLYFCQVQQS